MSTQQATSNQSHVQQPASLAPISDYYVELPSEALDEQGRLIDAVIHYSFDMLNVRRLDLRVVAEAR